MTTAGNEVSITPPAAPISWLRFAGFLLALALCGVAQWYIAHRLYWGPSSTLLVVGALVASILLGGPHGDAPQLDAAVPAGTTDWRGLILALLGFGLFAFAIYRLSVNWPRNFDTAAPLTLVGVVLWSVGLAWWESPQRGRAVRFPTLGWERWLFLVILAVGAFLRFYRFGSSFDSFPPPDGFCAIEEPQSGQGAFQIFQQGYRPWEFLGDRWMGVAAFALMGQTLTALRVPFILASILTIIPLYLLLRELVSRPAALFATALFTICRWHLIYARYAHNIFPTTLVVVLVLYLCVRAHKRGGLALYPWIGFLTAYTLYTYAGYRGTALFVGTFFAISLFVHVRAWRAAIAPQRLAAARRALGRQVAGLVLAAVAFVAVVLPLGLILRNNPTFFLEAAVRATDDSSYYSPDRSIYIQQVINRTRYTAMMFNHVGDSSSTFNQPDRPQLDPVSGVLFTLGLAYCVIWGARRFQGFFAFTFLVLLIMGTIFVHNFDIRRLQGIIPLIFVLIGYFADRVAHVTVARIGARARALLLAVALVLIGFAFRDNFDVYFHGMADNMQGRSTFQNPYTIGMRYLHRLPPNAYFLMFSDTLNFFHPSDYEWWRGEAVPGKVTSDIVPILYGAPGPWTGRELHLFLVDPFEHDDIARMLRQRFPDAHCARLTDPDLRTDLHYSMCEAPSAAINAPLTQGVHARYFRGDATTPLVERVEPAIGFGFLPDACRFPAAHEKPPCRAEWDGTWNVPEAGRYAIQPEVRGGEMTATLDDQPIRSGLELTAGPHRIRVQARFRSVEEVGMRLRWRRAAARDWELIQFAEVPPATADH